MMQNSTESRNMAQGELLALAAERLAAESASRKAASKYDYVKVKVRLGQQLEHYYILSRFLVSRMLTVTRIPQYKAVRIALELKKELVDGERLEITQDELEEALFGIMRARGFGQDYVRRFRMITRFYQEKRPLIVLIAGSACTGKSTLAQQLASRLNLPNVLQTDVLCELLRASGISPLSSVPLWDRLLSEEALVSEFQQECAAIRKGLDGDLCKSIRDGKPIIIEGLHIDPAIYLAEFGGSHIASMPTAAQLQQQQATAAPSPSSSSSSSGSGPGLYSRAAGSSGPRGAAHGHPATPSSLLPKRPEGTDPEVSRLLRSLSFDDAAYVPSEWAEYRKQSPWRKDSFPANSKRPSSAQPGGRPGHVTFMLRSRSAKAAVLSPEITAGREVSRTQLRAVARTSVPEDEPLAMGSSPPGSSNDLGKWPHVSSIQKAPEATPAVIGAAEASAQAPTSVQPPTPTGSGSGKATGPSAGPVFVPIVLSVADQEYEGLVHDWYAGQRAAAAAAADSSGAAEQAGDDDDAQLAAVMARLRTLQRHLESREQLGVPVVQLGAGGLAETADRLHEYILQCIALALEQQHRLVEHIS